MIEQKIGKKFNFIGYTLEVRKAFNFCEDCFFQKHDIECNHDEIRRIIGECSAIVRPDDTSVIFIDKNNYGD